MTPGCDSRGRNDVRGRGGPGAALQRHRRCSRRWPPVRLCWVGGRSRSGGRASAATARSCGSSVARCARRRGVRRRCLGRCTVGRAARRGSRAPACGRWQGSIPVADALWAQRLTPSPESLTGPTTLRPAAIPSWCCPTCSGRRSSGVIRRSSDARDVKGGAKLDHRGGGKLDHPAVEWRG